MPLTAHRTLKRGDISVGAVASLFHSNDLKDPRDVRDTPSARSRRFWTDSAAGEGTGLMEGSQGFGTPPSLCCGKGLRIRPPPW
jgi:hypothetical protein